MTRGHGVACQACWLAAIPRFERISASLRRFSRCGVPEYASLFRLLVP